MPKAITATTIENVRAAEPGRRRELFDTQAPGLCLRVSDKGHKTFYWRGRVKGLVNRKGTAGAPIRVLIGDARLVGLGDARDLAREYARQALRGEDPRAALKVAEVAKAKEAASKFEIVAERYIEIEVAKMARPKAVAAPIRNYLIATWKGRPVASITDADVAEVIQRIKEDGKAHTAIMVLAYCKSMFSWASSLGQRKSTGLNQDPCIKITAKEFKLDIQARQVSLSDDQLRIVWDAAGTLPDPWSAFTRMLILTGQRRSEVSDMAWREINFRDSEWTVPAARMKGKAGKRREHLVPLTPAMVEILETIKESQPQGAQFVFSTNNGRKAVTSFSDAKTALDKASAELAVKEGAEPLPDWRFHDLRRTVRTGFAKLERDIPATVAERVLAHVQGGIEAVYNVHGYAKEKRDALTLWNARLHRIVNPAPEPDNVVQIKAVQ